MKKIIYIAGFVAALLVFSNCSNRTTGTYHTYETECLGVEQDGSQTVWVWGTGRDKADAVEQAKKNAVSDVVFKGIQSGDPSCSQKPLLLEVNAREKHENYFNSFFQDQGQYQYFVTLEDTRRRSEVKQTSGKQYKYGMTVRVLRSDLKTKLINDKILKR